MYHQKDESLCSFWAIAKSWSKTTCLKNDGKETQIVCYVHRQLTLLIICFYHAQKYNKFGFGWGKVRIICKIRTIVRISCNLPSWPLTVQFWCVLYQFTITLNATDINVSLLVYSAICWTIWKYKNEISFRQATHKSAKNIILLIISLVEYWTGN